MLLLSLIAIALVDSLNPSIILMTLFLLGTEKPIRRTVSYVTAVYLTSLSLGLLAYFGLGAVFNGVIERILNTTAWWAYAIELVAAILILYFALTMKATGQQSAPKKPKRIDPKATFALGVGVTFIEFSTAAPYLAAIASLTKADVSAGYAVLSLSVYNLFYISIPLILFGIYFVKREAAAAILGNVRAHMDTWIRKAAKVFFLLLGIVLLADFVGYVFGHPLLVF